MIHLLCGSTGAGKTHYGLRLAKKEGAIRFAVDEWMHTLFFPDLSGEIYFDWTMERVNRCEEQIWAVVESLTTNGIPVVLEVSMSTLILRDKQRARAAKLSMPFKLHYLDVDVETRRRRVRQRNLQKDETFSFEVNEEMFEFVEDMFEVPGESELADAIIVTS